MERPTGSWRERDRSAADLAERAVETDATPDGDRRGEPRGIAAPRRHERAGGDEGVERHVGGAVLDGSEIAVGRPPA